MDAERKIKFGIPHNIHATLEPHTSNIEEILSIPLDFPHADFHTKQVRLFTHIIGRGLEDSGIETGATLTELDQIARYHDSGYAFSRTGILHHSQHHYAGAFIASELGFSNVVIEGILHHSSDVIPEDSPFAVHIVNTADRCAGMGWTGLIRDAYYLGVRHPVMDNPDASEDLLVDLRHPADANTEEEEYIDFGFPSQIRRRVVFTDYEERVKKFCLEEMFPLIEEAGVVVPLRNSLEKWIMRFEGSDGKTTIDPILDSALEMMYLKYYNTIEARQHLTW